MSDDVRIQIGVAWWLRWYLSGVVLMCRMTGCRPDVDRLTYWVVRSVKMRVIK